MKMKRLLLSLVPVYGAILGLPAIASAGGTGMPWEGPLQQIADNVGGIVRRWWARARGLWPCSAAPHTPALRPGAAGALLLSMLFVLPSIAQAGGTGMPWEGPLQQIADSVGGPVARAIGIIAIIAAGLGIAFSEGGSGARKLLYVVLGLSVAFAAATWGISFLGFGGGSVM